MTIHSMTSTITPLPVTQYCVAASEGRTAPDMSIQLVPQHRVAVSEWVRTATLYGCQQMVYNVMCLQLLFRNTVHVGMLAKGIHDPPHYFDPKLLACPT